MKIGVVEVANVGLERFWSNVRHVGSGEAGWMRQWTYISCMEGSINDIK